MDKLYKWICWFYKISGRSSSYIRNDIKKYNFFFQ